MSLSNPSESNLLSLLFTNTPWGLVGDTIGLRGSSTAGSFYVSLHTATLSDTSTQATSEAAYGSYARVAVARSSGGWTVSGTAPTQAANAALVSFPQCSSGTESETYFVIGRDSSGTGEALFWGALTTPLAVSVNITPQFAIGALTATAD